MSKTLIKVFNAKETVTEVYLGGLFQTEGGDYFLTKNGIVITPKLDKGDIVKYKQLTTIEF